MRHHYVISFLFTFTHYSSYHYSYTWVHIQSHVKSQSIFLNVEKCRKTGIRNLTSRTNACQKQRPQSISYSCVHWLVMHLEGLIFRPPGAWLIYETIEWPSDIKPLSMRFNQYSSLWTPQYWSCDAWIWSTTCLIATRLCSALMQPFSDFCLQSHTSNCWWMIQPRHWGYRNC